MKKSFSNRIILEAYNQGQGVKSEVRGGIAFVAQKTDAIGLKVLATAVLNNGTIIPEGSVAYVKEDILFGPVAKDIRTAKAAFGDQKYIEIDVAHTSFIDLKETTNA